MAAAQVPQAASWSTFAVVPSWYVPSLLMLAALIETPYIHGRAGHEHILSVQDEVGGLEFQWLREYGPTWKIGGNFGVIIIATIECLQRN